jgi:hypothetical protein
LFFSEVVLKGLFGAEADIETSLMVVMVGNQRCKV